MLFFARTVITKENTMNKIWVDDIRRPPDESWNWVRTNDAARELLLRQPYTAASLDHDMGLHEFDPDVPDADMQVLDHDWPMDDGVELAVWMVKNNCVPPYVRIHSHNPIGARRMLEILRYSATEVIIHPYDPRWIKSDPMFPEAT